MRRRNWSGQRTLLGDERITLVGWPSRGGVIVLEWVNSVDFTFLDLNHLDPPLQRAADQDLEDKFCQRLLLLGARWFDSEARWEWFDDVASGDEVACNQLEMDEVPEPTFRERRWIKVGWPSGTSDDDRSGGGDGQGNDDTHGGRGLWVAEHDNGMNYGEVEWSEQQYDGELPGRLMLCRNMEDRCKVLRQFGAKFYERVEDYKGSGFLRAWQEKQTGEVGPLVLTNSS